MEEPAGNDVNVGVPDEFDGIEERSKVGVEDEPAGICVTICARPDAPMDAGPVLIRMVGFGVVANGLLMMVTVG